MAIRLSLGLYVRIQNGVGRLRDEEGQTLAEYGLIMSVVAVAVIVAAVFTFRDAIGGAFNGAANCLNGTAAGCGR